MEPSIELSQEDGPSVIALSILSSHAPLEAIEEHPKPHQYRLNINDRTHRLILFNLTLFIWSSLYLIQYLDAVYVSSSVMNELNLCYFVLISTASSTMITLKTIEQRQWIVSQHNECIQFLSFLHNLVALIYFIAFSISIAIIWRRCSSHCVSSQLHSNSICKLVFITMGWFESYSLWTICRLTVSTKNKKSGSRMQFIICFVGVLLHSISSLLAPDEQYSDIDTQSTVGIIGDIGWWTLSVTYFIALISECFTLKKSKISMIHSVLSFLFVTASILTLNRNGFEINDQYFTDRSWLLVMTFSFLFAIGLHSASKQRYRPRQIGERLNRLSIADPSPFDDQLEGTLEQDSDPLLVGNGIRRMSYRLKQKKEIKKSNSNILRVHRYRTMFYCILLYIASIQRVISLNDDILQIIFTVIMLLVTLSVMIVVIQYHKQWDLKWNKSRIIRWGIALLFGLCSVLQIAVIINMIGDTMNAIFISSVFGANGLSVFIPLLLSLDIIWSILEEIEWRVFMHSMIIGISTFLYFIGYSENLKNGIIENETEITWYMQLSEYGWVIHSVLCGIVCISMLMGYWNRFCVKLLNHRGISQFVIGIGMVMVLGMELSFPFKVYLVSDDNKTEFDSSFIPYHDVLLLVPLSLLNWYEIQML